MKNLEFHQLTKKMGLGVGGSEILKVVDLRGWVKYSKSIIKLLKDQPTRQWLLSILFKLI